MQRKKKKKEKRKNGRRSDRVKISFFRRLSKAKEKERFEMITGEMKRKVDEKERERENSVE